MHPLIVVVTAFLLILVIVAGLYAYKVSITTTQIVLVVGIVFFVLLVIGLIYLIDKLLERKPSKYVDLEKESRMFVSEWYKQLTGTELTFEGAKFRENIIGNLTKNEHFALWLFPRTIGKDYLGVVVGTHPKMRIADWDWSPTEVGLSAMWEKFSPLIPGYASEFATPEQTIYAMRKSTPTVIKETIKETDEWNKATKGKRKDGETDEQTQS